jgi:hypothetical protein
LGRVRSHKTPDFIVGLAFLSENNPLRLEYAIERENLTKNPRKCPNFVKYRLQDF